MRQWITFRRVLWIAGILAALAVALGPLIQEAIARETWRAIPCYVSPDGRQFFFEFDGRRYYCSRMNMWFVPNTEAHLTSAGVVLPENNDTCYVDGGSPAFAVYRFDAYRHLEGGIGNFTGGVLILVAVAVVNWLDARRRARRSGSM
jgi:hypothetical protein